MATAPLQWFISYVFTIRPPQSTINVYKNNTRNTQTRSSLSNTNNWIREERETNSVSVIFSHNDLEYFQIYFHVHVALPLKPGWGLCKSHFTHYLHFFLLLRQANAHPPCCCWKYCSSVWTHNTNFNMLMWSWQRDSYSVHPLKQTCLGETSSKCIWVFRVWR